MRKELIVYCETNEEDTEVSVQRVSDNPDFILLKLGGFAVAINRHELAEALENVSLYGRIFDEESQRKANAGKLEESRAAARERQSMEVSPALAPGLKQPKKKKKVDPEDEGAVVIDVIHRTEPTESELKLAKLMSGLGDFKKE